MVYINSNSNNQQSSSNNNSKALFDFSANQHSSSYDYNQQDAPSSVTTNSEEKEEPSSGDLFYNKHKRKSMTTADTGNLSGSSAGSNDHIINNGENNENNNINISSNNDEDIDEHVFSLPSDKSDATSVSVNWLVMFQAWLIVMLGGAVTVAFLIWGISSARAERDAYLQEQTRELVHTFQLTWHDYEVAALMMHQTCRKQDRPNGTYSIITGQRNYTKSYCSRRQFQDLYEYLASTGLHFQAASWIVNITSEEERIMIESETASYLQTNPIAVSSLRENKKFSNITLEYEGFMGFKLNANDKKHSAYQWSEVVSGTSEMMEHLMKNNGSSSMEYMKDEEHKHRRHLRKTRRTNHIPRFYTPELIPRAYNQSYYLPAHYVLPLDPNNYGLVDFDFVTSRKRMEAINKVIRTYEPIVTEPLPRIVRLLEDDPLYYSPNKSQYDADALACDMSVMLYHPGIPLHNTSTHLSRMDGMALIVVRIQDFLYQALKSHHCGVDVHLYDYINKNDDDVILDGYKSAIHIGGARVIMKNDDSPRVITINEIAMDELLAKNEYYSQGKLRVADREWYIVVVCVDNGFFEDTLFINTGGVFVLVCCVCLALWYYHHSKRTAQTHAWSVAAESERAALILSHAQKAAKVERDLNDFLAHEVRNPLSAALSATCFVSSEIEREDALATKEAKQLVQEDLNIVTSSLQFINDLLRNLLDMHRAEIRSLNLQLAPTDLVQDVLEPVAAMLYYRGNAFELVVDCEFPHMIVMTDRMRLKQIVMNLASNARKFVQKGFIKLSARVVPETQHVEILVQDSGPGIPKDKYNKLFVKFQDSLDSLNQGTGIGLSLCEKLVKMMGGNIYLDTTYHSGVEGCPGACFVVDLNTPVISQCDQDDEDTLNGRNSITSLTKHHVIEIDRGTTEHVGLSDSTTSMSDSKDDSLQTCSTEKASTSDSEECNESEADDNFELPTQLSVLFVDDDTVLRKLFVRSVRRVAPEWTVAEAANGEKALQMAENETFDLIFMDQYMASCEKQLLGTETVRALRSKGVSSSIMCGLSANDAKQSFLQAGADTFLLKPFPCKPAELSEMLKKIILMGRSRWNNK